MQKIPEANVKLASGILLIQEEAAQEIMSFLIRTVPSVPELHRIGLPEGGSWTLPSVGIFTLPQRPFSFTSPLLYYIVVNLSIGAVQFHLKIIFLSTARSEEGTGACRRPVGETARRRVET